MAETVVTFALEQIRDLLLQGMLLSSVGNDVKALQTQLIQMKYLIEDADRRRHENKTVSNWIAEIRDLAYRAEAAIEIHAARLSSNRRQGPKKRVRRYACILQEYRLLHQLDSEISHIKSGLERVTKNMQDYGIRRIINPSQTSAASNDERKSRRKTYPEFEIEDCFVGMEHELKQLDSLLVEDKQHRVISVWGMGGVGKTTIARKVYNQMSTKKNGCFDLFAWVCITQQCQTRSVLEDVAKQLDPQKRKNGSSASCLQAFPQMGKDLSSLTVRELMEQLHEIQRAQRCLIVLDDLWKTSHWDGIKHAFLVEDLQSKILVTTRNKDVAGIGFSLQLGLLDEDNALELLKKKAFPYTNISDFAIQENLRKIGKEMVKKCGYLPLAISLLGGVLSKKNPMTEWEVINENMNEYIYRAEGDEKEYQIEGVLNLSYEDLPYYLKPCFLYLGTLKEDESIDVFDLYVMWIAQGMISSDKIHGNKETLIDIAESYLSELSSRCIVQVEVDSMLPTEKYRTCKLHDVVRELCLLIGKIENFGVQTLKYQGGNFRTILQKNTRYLVIHLKGEVHEGGDELSITGEEDTRKHIRSLQIVRDMFVKAIDFPTHGIVDFHRFKMLRDLIIIGFKFSRRKLPRGITDLVHLRCLRLQECKLDELPPSIRNLVYLETLDLLNSSNVQVPNVLKKMFRLRHLIMPTYFEDKIGNYQLRFDQGLEELESLMGFDTRVHELKPTIRMKNLRSLSASIHDNKSLSIIIDAISTSWNKLRLCVVTIEEGCKLTRSKEVLKMLKEVFKSPNLNYLVIDTQLGNLLEECRNNMIRSKLVVLSLSQCEIEDDPMGVLGELPSLRQLFLAWGSFVGEEMTCPPSSFPRLEKLDLSGLPKLRGWRVEEGAMPLLSQLNIHDCLCLEMVPDGLSRISTLKKMTISRMPELGKRVAPSGKDFHKVCHVPSITIYDRYPFTPDEN